MLLKLCNQATQSLHAMPCRLNTCGGGALRLSNCAAQGLLLWPVNLERDSFCCHWPCGDDRHEVSPSAIGGELTWRMNLCSWYTEVTKQQQQQQCKSQ